MLGNPTGFAGRHPGLADGVQQAGLAVVDVTHHCDNRRTPDQMGQIAGLDHFHGFLGRGFDIVFEDRNAEFVRNGLDRGQIEGLGHCGDDALEEQGLDDLGAFDSQTVRQFLHREVALRHDQHLGTLGLSFPGRSQLHGAATLTLAGGFFFALANGDRWLDCGSSVAAGLGGPGQARLEH